jgi:phage terminase large subunit-like protein
MNLRRVSRAVVARYAGTRLGRQELDGEMLEDRPGALFPRARIEARAWRRRGAGTLRIVVAVDPPASSREGADACGIVAGGAGRGRHFTCWPTRPPRGFRRSAGRAKAIALYRRLEADALSPRSTRAARWCAR